MAGRGLRTVELAECARPVGGSGTVKGNRLPLGGRGHERGAGRVRLRERRKGEKGERMAAELRGGLDTIRKRVRGGGRFMRRRGRRRKGQRMNSQMVRLMPERRWCLCCYRRRHSVGVLLGQMMDVRHIIYRCMDGCAAEAQKGGWRPAAASDGRRG